MSGLSTKTSKPCDDFSYKSNILRNTLYSGHVQATQNQSFHPTPKFSFQPHAKIKCFNTHNIFPPEYTMLLSPTGPMSKYDKYNKNVFIKNKEKIKMRAT